MKTKNIFSLLLILYISTLHSQCPGGSVYLNSQTDVDNFIIDYPSCTEINGNLQIYGSSNTDKISNLSGLTNIESITGLLSFNSFSTNININGLNNLKTTYEFSFSGLQNGFGLTGDFSNLETINNYFLEKYGRLLGP